MKKVLLSADGEISVFSVPDKVADHLDRYCRDFCDGWLRKSPDARKYYRKENGWSGLVYNEMVFIDYLNQYVFREKIQPDPNAARCLRREEFARRIRGFTLF